MNRTSWTVNVASGLTAILFALMLFCTGPARADLYTYTGGSAVNPNDWSDSANWTSTTGAAFPSGTSDDAVIPDGHSPAFINTPSQLRHFTTGDGLVTMPSTLTIGRGGTPTQTGAVNIGSGGITFTAGGLLSDSNGGKIFNTAGTIVSPALGAYDAQLNQTGGHLDVSTLHIGGGGAAAPTFLIQAWDIQNAAGMTIGQTTQGHNDQSIRFDATPLITGGRPNWDFINTSGDGGNNSVIDLNGHTMYGDRLRLGGRRNGYGGSILRNTVAGGELDLNSIQIAMGGNANARDAYLDLSAGTTVLIQGSSTAWNNNSINNTNFNIIDSTVVFDPAGGTLSISTGSEDRGGANAADWDDNFAFGNLRITENSTVTVTGTDNFGDTNASALYVRGTLYGEHNSTIDGGRNIYVYGGLEPGSSPGTLNIVGNLFLGENAVSTFELNDPNVAGGGINDLVAITGDLTLDGLLEVNLADPMLLANYTLFTYTGTLTDNGMILNTMLAKPAIGDMSVPGIVTLNVIPEPTSGILLALAGLALLKRRRQ